MLVRATSLLSPASQELLLAIASLVAGRSCLLLEFARPVVHLVAVWSCWNSLVVAATGAADRWSELLPARLRQQERRREERRGEGEGVSSVLIASWWSRLEKRREGE
ncbi:hypothetical protein H5410_001336 [Solanum commersonii]|uniref:Uncharacterized protein n=1 Tax=Solanum commersonii TaxID=4109 RepID=A0A9J6AZD0_SOLCO|nr:hypothetical protein H5410_001336 [Solanum commersonii]